MSRERFIDITSSILAYAIMSAIVVAIIVGLVWVSGEIFYAIRGWRYGEPVPTSYICANAENVTQQCIDYRIDQCMITERYTLDQCVTLVGR